MSEDCAQPPSLRTAHAVVDALIDRGVSLVAYCPGSRNAPFAYVLDAAERRGLLRVEIFSDERSAGFWAVGAAKGLGSGPVVPVFTTSGTATLELSAALREAGHQGAAVLAVTADRPHESRGVGASQTTAQEHLYGPSVIAQASIPAQPGTHPGGLRQVRDQVGRILAAMLGHAGVGGPGHLNVAFREPLVPSGPIPAFGAAPLAAIWPAHRTFPEWADVVVPDLRTVVVAGDRADQAVVEAAAARSLPILAEPSSGACGAATWVPHAPLILPALASTVQQVVVTGRPTLSRPVAALLGAPALRKVVVSARAEWPDVAGTAAAVTEGIQDTAEAAPRRGSQDYLRLWLNAAAKAESVLSAEKGLNLFSVCRAVWQAPGEDPLWLGASNTVRGFELAAGQPGRRSVSSNRGLAGIDGTIAAAAGLAAGTGRPVRAVMGDLTYTADLSSLAQQLESAPNLQLVVLDDGGGSIFASLEHGDERFAHLHGRYFSAPPRLDGPAAARACGWEATRITGLEHLRQALARPIRGRTVLWVPLPHPAEQIREVTARLA